MKRSASGGRKIDALVRAALAEAFDFDPVRLARLDAMLSAVRVDVGPVDITSLPRLAPEIEKKPRQPKPPGLKAALHRTRRSQP